MNSAVGKDKGLDHAKLAAVATWRTSDLFSPLERDALALADAMADTPTNVDLDLFNSLHARLGNQGIVELATVIGWESFRASTNRVFDARAESFYDGVACMIPPGDSANAA
jgi:alkylhydroperoxidase family enzyme